uniref:hypothetical protein n=1 Tax=Vibrio mexicanus TaxID=1004326 RepID=UPI00063C8AC5
MKSSKSLLALGVAAALSLSGAAFAADSDVHDADPRNTAWRGGIATDHTGEIKLVAGGGFNNLYGNNEYTTQTIMIGEYFTQSENFRFRLANFDERFGGVYADVNLSDPSNMYTAGYMLPLTATNGVTMLFPSVNYSYIDIDTGYLDSMAPQSHDAYSNTLNGYSTGSGQAATLGAISSKDALGGDDAHLVSVNLYGLQPWNDT